MNWKALIKATWTVLFFVSILLSFGLIISFTISLFPGFGTVFLITLLVIGLVAMIGVLYKDFK